MKDIHVWFVGWQMENHREPGTNLRFIDAMRKQGIILEPEPDKSQDFFFCGQFYCNQELLRGCSRFPHVPVVHYVWDLYPFQIEGIEAENEIRKEWWKDYTISIKSAREVWIPSGSVLPRIKQFACNEDVHVIKSTVYTWHEPVWDGGYVLDPLRKYPDRNRDAVKTACDRLGIKCVESRNNLPFTDFKKMVAGARLIVSAPYEASTGGLSLLEGHALGKQVLISNSDRNGAHEYFGWRAEYFAFNDLNHLTELIDNMYHHPKVLDPVECRQWVESNFNDDVMAEKMARRLRAIL